MARKTAAERNHFLNAMIPNYLKVIAFSNQSLAQFEQSLDDERFSKWERNKLLEAARLLYEVPAPVRQVLSSTTGKTVVQLIAALEEAGYEIVKTRKNKLSTII